MLCVCVVKLTKKKKKNKNPLFIRKNPQTPSVLTTRFSGKFTESTTDIEPIGLGVAIRTGGVRVFYGLVRRVVARLTVFYRDCRTDTETFSVCTEDAVAIGPNRFGVDFYGKPDDAQNGL